MNDHLDLESFGITPPTPKKKAPFSLRNFLAYDNMVLFIVITVLAMAVRFSLFPIQSADYRHFLEPWYNHIQNNGYFKALAHGFADYPPMYLYYIVFIAWLDIDPLVWLKIFSCLFDFITAIFIFKMVRQIYPKNKTYAHIAYALALFLPHAIMNGSVWGQCDAIYTCFLVISIYFLMNKRNIWGLVAFGIAFSFKVQSIFLLPVFFILFWDEKIKLFDCLIVPLIYFVSVFPAYLAGRPLPELLLIYFNQAGTYAHRLQLNYPNIYHWMGDNHTEAFSQAGIILAFSVMLLTCFAAKRLKASERKTFVIDFAYLSMLLLPYLMPHIHDRYSYPADIVAILYFFQNPKKAYVPIGLLLITLTPYTGLFNITFIDYKLLSVGYGILLAMLFRDLWQKYKPAMLPAIENQAA